MFIGFQDGKFSHAFEKLIVIDNEEVHAKLLYKKQKEIDLEIIKVIIFIFIYLIKLISEWDQKFDGTEQRI